jgi:MFS family permease
MHTLLLSIAGLLFSQALLLTGHGLALTLLPLRAELEGFSLAQIGLTATTYFAGFTLGCMFTPTIARTAGHIRAFAVLASVASAVVLVHPLWPAFVPWLVLRFVSGWCIAGLYMLIESWLNERASNQNRGTLMAIYMVITMVMIMVGQLLINLGDIGRVTLFAISSILLSLSVVPVSLSTGKAPAPIRSVRVRLGELWHLSHIAFSGSFAAGLATGAFWGLGPVYGSLAGLDTFQITLFMAAAVAGGAVFQFPLGRMSDHYDRRLVALGAAAAATIAALLLGVFPTTANGQNGITGGVLIGLSFLFGAFVMPLYALVIAHANDRAGPDEFVVVASGLLMLFGIGAALGAPLASLLMIRAGPGGLFLFSALSMFGLALAIVRRRRTRTVPVVDESEQPFVPVADLTPIALDLDPRTDSDEDPPASGSGDHYRPAQIG